MQLRYQATGREGYEAIVQANSGLAYFHEFGILRLNGEDTHQGDTGDYEAFLHIIEGACDVVTPDGEHAALGGRETPFAGKTAAVYLPPGTVYNVRTRSGPVELTVTLAPAPAGGAVAVIGPEAATSKRVGRDNWQRDVTMIAAPDSPVSQRLVMGETLNPAGNWSGVPAHKHDTLRPGQESVQEEIYYFRVDRPGGWGIERIYNREGLDELMRVEDRTVVLIPRGYHTVAAAPGFTLYYAFVLSGPDKALVQFFDPVQAGALE